MLFYLLSTLNLFHGKHRSAFMAKPWSGGISTSKFASFINCLLSSLGITCISRCSCTTESSLLTIFLRFAIS